MRIRFVGSDGIEREHASEVDAVPFSAVDPVARKAEVVRIVGGVAKSALLPGELSPRDAREVVERTEREARERLEREIEFADILRRPVSEIVAEVCKALGYTPDWPGLADQPWAQHEMRSGHIGDPLRALSPLRVDREAEAQPSVGIGGDAADQHSSTPPDPQRTPDPSALKGEGRARSP